MDSTPSSESKEPIDQNPEAEVLQPRTADNAASAAASTDTPLKPATPNRPQHRTYHPSHKATLIGLGVVLLILAINAVVFTVLLKKQSKNELEKKGQVTISTADLNRLGINRTAIGSSNVDLIVSPNAQFKGRLAVAGNTSISGQLILNSKLTGTDASISQLQAGNTSLSQLNVNGDSTMNSLNLRKDLVVAGLTQLQGPVTLSQLLTVTNGINVTGNLAVGGVLTGNTVNARILSASSSLGIGGHIISSGATPSVGGGPALGSNGTVSISGNDIAGTISINTGAGAGAGTLASVTFKSLYSAAPKVVITPVGASGSYYISSTSANGFAVAVSSGLAPGGYRINYIVVQ